MLLEGFISYAHRDRKFAHQVKTELGKFGISCFLAHEDIKPSASWVQNIEDRLRSCDLFIALISDNSCASDWTDQEAGMAYALNKKVVPVMLGGIAPYGFVGRYQGIKLNPITVHEQCFEIVSELANDKATGEIDL